MISSANSVSTRLPSGRRLYARHIMDGLAYADFGTDHPAILTDLGEGGLGFQSVVPVNLDPVFHLKLKVSRVTIESNAELIWLNESGKCGGLRFVELSADALAQIREWIAVVADREAGPRVHPAEAGSRAGSAQAGATKESRVAATQESHAPSALQNQSRPSESIAGSDTPSHNFQAGVSPDTYIWPRVVQDAWPQSQKRARTSPQQGNLPDLQKRKSTGGATPASGVLSVGIGAAAGALLMLALMAFVPALRSHVQAIANPKSSGSNLPDAQVFQVEVADLSNQRWILKSGGEAASPFSNLPPQTGTHAAAATGSRGRSAKASRSEDNATPDKPQVKLPTPGELGLARPLEPQAAAVPPQVVPPSIFDGITPPIGSVSEQLTAIGQDATGPGIVKPQSPASLRPSAVQAAVLVQRVEPVYPDIALASGVAGQVRLSVTIGRDGVPKNIKILNGDTTLAHAALTAVSQWRYRPATLGGEPIETQTIVSLDFER